MRSARWDERCRNCNLFGTEDCDKQRQENEGYYLADSACFLPKAKKVKA
jgi:hypothetical protein